jgi:hypothetical protein
LRIDAISLPDLLGSDARKLATSRRVKDRYAVRDELKGISIAACHQGEAACALLKATAAARKSSLTFVPCSNELRQYVQLPDQVIVKLSPGSAKGIRLGRRSILRMRSFLEIN